MRMQKYQTLENPRCRILKEMMKMRPMSKEMCLVCKGGRLLCGQTFCPLLKRIEIQKPSQEKLSEVMYGKSPSIFVGWHYYPEVYVGPMMALDDNKAETIDDPSKWYGANFDEIIEMRSLLLRSKKREFVMKKDVFIERSQEIALSSKPVYVENEFKGVPKFGISFSPITQPLGPSGILNKFHITENPKIPKMVDKMVSDELRSKDAVFQLYRHGYDVYYLTNVLSSGALGIEDNRKLVPTRWSITAVDDIISKEMMKEIRNFPSINDFLIYSNNYLDNHFEILMIPGKWEFEQFEAWAPRTLWTLSSTRPVIVEESEPFHGRTTYAEREGGGYYAGRFAVTEFLYKIKRQCRVIIFREISEGYVVPVGVWEVRENVRNALRKRPLKFDNLNDALSHLDNKLRIPVRNYISKSEILKQRRITDFL